MIEEIKENINNYLGEVTISMEKLSTCIDNYIVKNNFNEIKSILCPDNDKYNFNVYTDVYGNFFEIRFSLFQQPIMPINEIQINIEMDIDISKHDCQISISKNIDLDCWNKDNYNKVLKILNLEEIDYEIL